MPELVALALQPPTFDPMRATLAGLSSANQQVQTQSALQAFQQEQRRQAALDAFSAAGGMNSRQALGSLSAYPDLYTQAMGAMNQRQQANALENARGAQRALAFPEGSSQRAQIYQEELARAAQEGRIDPSQHAQYSAQPPTDLFLNGIVKLAQAAPTEKDAAEAALHRAQAANLIDQQRMQEIMGTYLFGPTFRAATSAAPAAGGAPAAAASPSAALGPVTPRVVQTIPLDRLGATGTQTPDVTMTPQGTPVGTYMTGGGGKVGATSAAPVGGITVGPDGMLYGGTDLRAPAQGAGPQVRGWLASGQSEDAETPPLSGGLPFGGAPAAAPAAAAQPAAQQAGPQGALASLPRDQQIAAALLFSKGKYEELAKMLSESAVAEKTAAAQERGKALGTAQANLPQVMQNTESMLRNIDAVINDPYLGYVTGFQSSGWNPLSWKVPFTNIGVPTTPWGHDTMERINQVIGQSFLQAYQGLRGGGQITEIEGKKAQDAIMRLSNLAQSDAGYMKALNDARYEIWDLMNLARRKAGQPPIPYVPHTTDTDRLTRISGDADFDRLPSGMPFIDPKGNVRIKP